MKTIFAFSPWKRRLSSIGLSILAVLLGSAPGWGATAPFGVPVRLSFKFILNSSGNRPATGNLNTDEEILAQIVLGNEIYSRFTSEIRMHNVEILNVSGASQYYTNSSNIPDRDALRNAAIADPTRFYWRNNAINVYITGAGGSAISDFPPYNNVILCAQGSHGTTIPHEMGHSVNLIHTHENDTCSDTLLDDASWDRDDISVNNYGSVYASLTSGQKYNVDMVWSNLMSYHNTDSRCMISACQLERVSTQTYTDRTWMLSKVPVYVDAAYVGTYAGSFTQPYQTIQQAITAGVLGNKVMVLKTGTFSEPASIISTSTDVVTRKGSAVIKDAPPLYSLPSNLEESANPAVRAAVIRAQECDQRKDLAGVLANLQEAEKAARGREKTALQMEIAQRFRDSKRPEEAAQWFQHVADGADQPKLLEHALGQVEKMKAEALKQKQQKQNPKEPKN